MRAASCFMQLVESLQNLPFSLDLGRVYHLVFLFCLVFVVQKFAKLCVEKHKWAQILRTFPGPPQHWLYGHFHEFQQDGINLKKSIQWGQSYPLAFLIWFGPFIPYLIIHHPAYVKTLLASSEPKDDVSYKYLIPWIGDGLIGSSGNKWFRHRRLLTPGFHYEVLKPYLKIMNDSTKAMLVKWEAKANQDKSFEIFEYLSRMALGSIMKCAFSCETNMESGNESYVQVVYELTYLVDLRIRTFPYHSDIIFHLSPHGYKFRKACRIAHQHTTDLLQKRKAFLEEEKKQGGPQNRSRDFLDILLGARDEQQQGLTDEEIRAEVDTFMFAGHDSTACGISWILYNLACNQECQQRARQEVQQVLDGKDTMDWEDLSKIPYLTMCIKESIRLFPPVPMYSRKLTKPMTFFDGRSVPEGCLVGVNVYGIHRNPTVWENPDVFDPLRFLPENCAKRSPHAFVPFSAGPRNCIGQNFAMNEMKVTIALILRRFQLENDPEITPQFFPCVVLRPRFGIHLKIKRLEDDF